MCTCMVLPLGAVCVRVWYYHWGLCVYTVPHSTCMFITFFSAFYLLCMVVVVVCISEPQLFHAKYSHAQCNYSTIALTCVCVFMHECVRACVHACVHVCVCVMLHATSWDLVESCPKTLAIKMERTAAQLERKSQRKPTAVSTSINVCVWYTECCLLLHTVYCIHSTPLYMYVC